MIKIKKLRMQIPIIQGGMGIGVSLGNLAGHVAKFGGMGVISTANPGYRTERFWRFAKKANKVALKEEIQKAKEIAQNMGIVAVNAMVATTYYADMIKSAVEAGADAIISGAGLPKQLPSLVKDSGVAIAPIVSSGKAAKVICRLWDRNDQVAPDFIVVEGVKAGGHLGFSKEDIIHNNVPKLSEILTDVLQEIKPYEEKYQREIPVFVAGGVFTGKDIAKYTALGAAGAQMGTRFAVTKEGDADNAFKQAIVDAKPEDVVFVKSPVGMPGRAIRTKFTEQLEADGSIPVSKCMNCLIPCHPADTPYCISEALIQAAKGNIDEGLVFSGSEAGRIKEIITVEALITELVTDWEGATKK